MCVRLRRLLTALALVVVSGPVLASYTNFESSHVHPLTLTPNGKRLLAVNTPDSTLEVFQFASDGALIHERSIPVGLEPVSVAAVANGRAYVVNQLSDSVTIVNLSRGHAVDTLDVGDEPTDVEVVGTRVFVTVAGTDEVLVFNQADLSLPPQRVPIFGRKPRALAVSEDGSTVYAVVLQSGNKTSIVSAHAIWRDPFDDALFVQSRLADLNEGGIGCPTGVPPYPPLPSGITRNPSLDDPVGTPPVGLIVRFDEQRDAWVDEAGTSWDDCLRYRLPDQDLFAIDVNTLQTTAVSGVGTILFDVAVQPGTGHVWVPNTEARNFTRFEHPLGVEGHVVDNVLTRVDPDSGSVTHIDLNAHIDRSSTPPGNLPERLASISQPGQLVWSSDGSTGYLTAIGSRKLFFVDGTCSAADCIFGPDRSAPWAVEVGEGPSGVALDELRGRAYVFNRFSNSIAVVDTASRLKVDEVALHDPSDDVVKEGRRLLYDAVLSSGHGDAACSSCHISGDLDGLSWNLGNPEGQLQAYSNSGDNVRFVLPSVTQPAECNENVCPDHEGFDPQKGPMTTQTLRGMLEPLHWRGDRATFREFNPAFVGLLGAEDIGPINGAPGGLDEDDIELFRQFALGIAFPPNPHRNLDDTLPDQLLPVPAHAFSGNPEAGRVVYEERATAGVHRCTACHTRPFGAAGGVLGGVEPVDPASNDAAGIVPGTFDVSSHSDMKVAHLRNMYEKTGPSYTPVGEAGLREAKSGFGYGHDGGYPNLGVFFSLSFALTAQDARDVAAFMMHFPTETQPAVGRSLTIGGTATPEESAILSTLLSVGDAADPDRHCELTATAYEDGRTRRWRYVSNIWLGDAAFTLPRSTAQLRNDAESVVTFLCTTPGAGARLGGDRDEDGTLDGDDCAPADPTLTTAAEPFGVRAFDKESILWDAVDSAPGDVVRYDVLRGGAGPTPESIDCLASAVTATEVVDSAVPQSNNLYFYLVRSRTQCGVSTVGDGRDSIDAFVCP